MLGLSLRSLEHLISQREIPIRRIGRRVLIARSVIEVFAKTPEQTSIPREDPNSFQGDERTLQGASLMSAPISSRVGRIGDLVPFAGTSSNPRSSPGTSGGVPITQDASPQFAALTAARGCRA